LTRIDFYILPDVDLEARRRFACRLAYKAVTAGQRVHVHVADVDASRDLDALMWEYPDHRFLPHGINGEPASVNAPVVIDHREPESGADQLLINLAATMRNWTWAFVGNLAGSLLFAFMLWGSLTMFGETPGGVRIAWHGRG